jgi:tetratricopeptide (TPR) repeat protein
LPATDSESKKNKNKPVIPIFGDTPKVGKTVMVAFSTLVNNPYRSAIAAAFSLLIVATIILLNINSNGSPEAIFADHYVPFENQGSHIVRGNNEKGENADQMMIREALLKYDNGDYLGAAEIFDRIEVTDSNKYQVWLYGGNAYLHEGQVEKAKLMFQSIIDEDAGYVIQAKWYLSLCHIKNGDIEQAKPLLEDIKNEDKSSKSEEAGKILSRLQ